MPSLAIACVDTHHYHKTIHALRHTIDTLAHLNTTGIYWFSDIPFPEPIHIPVMNVVIPKINPALQEQGYLPIYSRVMLHQLPEIVCNY